MFPTEKTKRKNEAPRSSRRLVVALTALLVLIAGIGLFLTSQVAPSDPTGQLFYGYTIDPTAEVVRRVDLKTGLSDQYAWLPPKATSVGYEAPPPARRIVHGLRWYRVSNQVMEYELIVQDVMTHEDLRVLGRFYTNFYSFTNAHWSPDGQWVVFSVFNEPVPYNEIYLHDQDIWMAHPESGEVRRMTNNDYDDRNPTFMMDGRSILYVSDQDGSKRLYTMDIASGESRLLTPDLALVYNYAWSPDDQTIAFTAYDPQAAKSETETGDMSLRSLYVMNPITGALREAASDRISSYHWSPDSQWLAFTTRDPISTLNEQSGESAPHAAAAASDPYYEKQPSSVWIVRTNGSDKQMVGGAAFSISNLDWIP